MFFFCFVVFEVLIRTTSLGPNPPYFLRGVFWGVFVMCFVLLCLEKRLCFPLKRGYFCSFVSVSLCFSLAFLTSLSLSLSLSLVSFSIFPSLFSFVLPCFSFFFLACLFAFVSRKEHQNIIFERLFSSILSVFWVSCFVLPLKSHFLIFTLFLSLGLWAPPPLTLPFGCFGVSFIVWVLVFVVFALF